ncbi:hypothetical protein INT45_006437 [Circinella minor]|uniref:Uncharacterized protein n=1 Tax=Circinella minor TaxID=1195481 RepID=A0A8H7VND1_9FUNG|nr:hypothetical protein INT45_006437 [Circinella minor]
MVLYHYSIAKILNIIQDVSTEIISRDKGTIELIVLVFPSQQETRFVKSIIRLIGKLPRNPMSVDTNGSELGSRYIDPFLCGLFDDPDYGVYLRWTNEITLEARKNNDYQKPTWHLHHQSLHETIYNQP